MRRRKWALIGLVALVGAAIVAGSVYWLLNRPAAEAKQLFKVAIPIGGGRLGSHPSNTVAAAISSDGHIFLVALEDGTVWTWSKQWDNDQFEGLDQVTPGQLDPAQSTPDGNTLIPLSLTDLAITPDAVIAVIGFAVHGKAKAGKPSTPASPQTGAVRVWDFTARQNRISVTLPDPVDVVSIAPHGEVVAVATGPHHPLRMLDGVTGKVLWSDPNAYYTFGPLAFSSDGKLLAAGVDRQVRVYDARSGQVRRECNGPEGSMLAVCFSADGSRVAAGGADRNLFVWDLNDPKRDLILPLQLPSEIDEPTPAALAFEAKSDSLVAFVPRQVNRGFFERWRNPPPPGIEKIDKITGSLIVRRELTPGGKTTVLLETDKVFSKVRFAQDAHRFVQSNAGDPWVGVWEY